MARLFNSGFEWGSLAGEEGVTGVSAVGTWTSGTTYNWVTSGQRSGRGGLQLLGSGGSSLDYLSANTVGTSITNTYYARLAIKVSSFSSFTWRVLGLCDTSDNGVELDIDASGNLWVYDNVGGTASALSASLMTLSTGTWYVLELSWVPSTGAVVARVNGAQVYSGTGTTESVAAIISFIGNIGSGLSAIVDDWAVNDSTGVNQNYWCGLGQFVILLPTADSSNTGFHAGNGSTTTNLYDAVNNLPPVGVAEASATTASQITCNASSTTDNYVATMQTYTAAGVPAGACVMFATPTAIIGGSGTTSLTAGLTTTNPSLSEVTGTTGTTAAATFPSHWSGLTTTADYPIVALGTAPTLKIRKGTASTQYLMACFMGIECEYLAPVSGIISPVQEQFAALSTSSSSTSLTLANNVQAGNTLTLVSANFTNTQAITGVTGGGATWAKAASVSLPSGDGACTLDIWIGSNASAGAATITATYAATTSNGGYFEVMEWYGVASSSPLDSSVNVATNGTGTSISTGAQTPSEAGELFIAAVASQNSLSASIGVSPWDDIGEFEDTYSDAAYLWNLTDSAAKTASTTQGTSGGYGVLMIALLPASHSHSASLSDSVSPSEALARAAAKARALADSVSPSDGLTRAGGHVRSEADSVSPSELLARAGARARSTSDSVSPSDALALTHLYSRTTADSLSPSDALAITNRGYVRALADSVSPSELLARAIIAHRLLADSVSPSELLVPMRGRARSFGDSASPVEHLTHLIVLHPHVADSLSPSDALRLRSLRTAASDSISPSDALARGHVPHPRSLADLLPYADHLTNSGVHRPRALADSVSPSEAWIGNVIRRRHPSDSVSPVELLTIPSAHARLLVDVLPYSDTLRRLEPFARHTSDSVSPSELLRRGAFAQVRVLHDAASVADALARSLGRHRVLVDAAFPWDVLTGGGEVLVIGIGMFAWF